jgi:hypothetical protein
VRNRLLPLRKIPVGSDRMGRVIFMDLHEWGWVTRIRFGIENDIREIFIA